MKPLELQESKSVIKCAETIRKIMNPTAKKLPIILEEEVQRYELIKVIKQR